MAKHCQIVWKQPAFPEKNAGSGGGQSQLHWRTYINIVWHYKTL